MISYDDKTDVLSISLDNEICCASQEAEHDLDLIFDYNFKKEIIGFKIYAASCWLLCEWKGHSDRNLIPGNLLKLADDWYLIRNQR